MRYLLLAIFGAVFGLGGLVAWQAWDFMNTPAQSPGVETIVVIEPGESFEEIAGRLYAENLTQSALKLRILAKVTKLGAKVRAGEFALNTGWKPMELLTELTTSSGLQHKLAVPEGLTLKQIADLVEASGFGSAESFKKAASDSELLKKYNIPADSAEGFLFPETYFFTRRKGDDARYVVEAMLKEFNKRLAKAFPDNTPSGGELFDVITLASIVEKETGLASERPTIAGVFVNRLNRNMLLQTDPTIIYGLGDAFDGNLKRSHLEDPKNPYNTYVHPGLPPGPICSPGFGSLKAVASPEKHRLYYFVAMGDGSHKFSKSLREHNNAVIKYQKRRRKK